MHIVHIAAWDNKVFLVENTFRNNNYKSRMFNLQCSLQCSAIEKCLGLSFFTDTTKPLWDRKLIRKQYRIISKDLIWVFPPLNWLLYCLSSLSCCWGPLETSLFYPVPLDPGPRLWAIIKTLQMHLFFCSICEGGILGTKKNILCKFCFKWVD